MVYLVKMLDRTNVELLILATAFLKKLSIYQENKDQMAACDVVSRLVSLMATDNEVLLLACLRLLHNLSFDSGLQEEMIKQGLLPKVGLHCLPALFTLCLNIAFLACIQYTFVYTAYTLSTLLGVGLTAGCFAHMVFCSLVALLCDAKHRNKCCEWVGKGVISGFLWMNCCGGVQQD